MKEDKNKIENAICVENVSKRFVIPHDKASTLKGAFVNLFHKKSFEVFDALKDISFEIKKGEFFGIIGRNGSGKSTLLKILAGIYSTDTGKIGINGRISPFLELGIGFNPELSGRDNIYLNGTVLGLTEKEIDDKFDSIVAFSELERFIDQKIKNYSSGMSVRLAFSVAIHANREILIMDEVLAVGDTNFQSKCLSEFNKYRDEGKTVILVTHDIGTVQRYCDRAMLLRNGKIEMIGSPEEVGNKYIYQNMSDEEKRIFDEKNRLEKIKGNEIVKEQPKQEKIAEITEVKFLDKDGKEKNVFETGEKIRIDVLYKINKEINSPIFGIVIKDNFSKIPVFVTNTQLKMVNTGNVLEGEKTVSFIIDNLFGTGTYSVSPAIADVNARIFYDWKDDFKKFNIMNIKYNSGGIVDFNHSINI